MRIEHPTKRPNFCILHFDSGAQIAFSYETPIGVRHADEYHWYVRANEWGPTTGKHIKELFPVEVSGLDKGMMDFEVRRAIESDW